MSSKAYSQYVLLALTAVCTLNFVDRSLVMLLLQPIKVDLHLTDTQLGFVSGIAFGLLYATLGFPIARWADRGNRVTITAIAIGIWGVAMMMCLLVTNFSQLVYTRLAAAVGEAGTKPPTYSLIGDYFKEPSANIRAMAIYMVAGPSANLMAFLIGGWLSEHYGWRLAFFLMGMPGILFALLVKLTVREPRKNMSMESLGNVSALSLLDAFATMWRSRSFRHLTAALVILYMMGNGLGPWFSVFMVRNHGMTISALGLWLGLIFGLGGIVGAIAGGRVAVRWFSDNEPGQLALSAVTVLFLVPCFIMFLMVDSSYLALAALVPFWILLFFYQGPTYAIMQRLVPADMRATMIASVMFLANLLGLGIGPLFVGATSDYLAPFTGNESLRYSMLATSFFAFWAAYHFAKAAKTIRNELGHPHHI